MSTLDFTDSELAELPNILALARMNIGAQLANGARDEGGRIVSLLNAISGLEEKLKPQGEQTAVVPPSIRKRNNGAEARR